MHRLSFFATYRWKLYLSLAIAFLGDYLFYHNALFGGHLGLFAFALLLCLMVGRPNILRRWEGRLAAISAGIFGCALIVDPGILSWTMFWIAISLAALFGMTMQYDDGWLWFQRLLLHALRSPVAPFMDFSKVRRAARRVRRRCFSLRAILRVIGLPLLGGAIILTLFATANPIIARVLAMIEWPDLSAITPWRMILWLMFFVLGWSVLRPRVAKRLIPTFDGRGDLDLPGVSVASVMLSLLLFNAMFAVENALDVAYLSRALLLPTGMSMTEYVHRGAYPLIVTALLAGLFVLITLRPGSSTAAVPMIRWLVVLWIVQNIMLVTSSVQRTLEYIEASMLTTLRIQALAWMALVAAGLVLICWRMLRGKSSSWLINTNVGAAAAVLTLFCFIDAGEIAARWNVRDAREITGSGPSVDLCYLNRLGPSALLPLIALESQTSDPSFRDRVQAIRTGIYNGMVNDVRQGGWTWRNERRLQAADAMLKGTKPVRPDSFLRNCDGSREQPQSDVSAKAVPANPALQPFARPDPLTRKDEQ